jgi:RHS repeat-associated protein
MGYDAANQLTSIHRFNSLSGNNSLATSLYSYDKEGNRTSRTNIASGQVTEYTWDYRNRLTSLIVRTTAGGTITRQVDYIYDVYNCRIAKVVDLDGAGSQPATTEHFIYDGEHISLVFDGQGNVTERYLHGPQTDQVLAVEQSEQTQWFLTDHLGSIRQIVDETGAVINQVEYDSYGNIISQSNPNVTFRFGYTGREWDGETGQYYNRARYYDPSVGQFISQDPIGFSAGDANLYRYVGNSPTNFTDPSGLMGRPIDPDDADGDGDRDDPNPFDQNLEPDYPDLRPMFPSGGGGRGFGGGGRSSGNAGGGRSVGGSRGGRGPKPLNQGGR